MGLKLRIFLYLYLSVEIHVDPFKSDLKENLCYICKRFGKKWEECGFFELKGDGRQFLCAGGHNKSRLLCVSNNLMYGM